jgi:hypothetical protein
VRAVLQKPSELFLSHQYKGKVQDAYSLRCVPQVHGIAHDTVEFVRNLLNTELNSATDNPMCFTQEQVEAMEARALGPLQDDANQKHSPATVAAPPIPHKTSSSVVQESSAYPIEEERNAQPVTPHTSLDEANREIAMLRRMLKSEQRPTAAPWSFNKKPSDTRRCIDGGGLILSGGNCARRAHRLTLHAKQPCSHTHSNPVHVRSPRRISCQGLRLPRDWHI